MTKCSSRFDRHGGIESPAPKRRRSKAARANVERLEQRTLFASLAFAVDPQQTALTIAAMIGNIPLEPQTGTTFTTSYAGTINADVGTSTLQILATTQIVARNQPLQKVLPGKMPANYAFTGLGNENAAARNFVLSLSSQPVSVSQAGAFISTNEVIASTAGELDFGAPGATASVISLFPYMGTNFMGNNAPGPSTLISNGTLETLTIPVNVVLPVLFEGQPSGVQIGLTGTIVATAPVPQGPALNLNGSGATGGYSTQFTAGNAPVPSVNASALALTDQETNIITSATVTLTNPLDGASELLAANTSGSAITSVYDAATGVLTLSGSSAVANYQSVLRTVTYVDSAATPAVSAPRQIQFVVNDGTKTSGPVTSVITVFDATPPTLQLSAAVPGNGFTATFAQAGGPVSIAGADLSLTDPTRSTLQSATIVIENPVDGTNESLAADVSGTSLAAIYNPAAFTLTIQGAGTLADYATVLKTVTFADAALPPTTTPRMVSFTVNDGLNSNAPPAVAVISLVQTLTPPVLSLSGSMAQYLAGYAPVPVAPPGDLSISDMTNSTLQSATVTIQNPQDNADEVLSADTTGTSITSTYDTSSHVLTLTGPDTLANFQTVLQTVSYNDSSLTPNPGSRQIIFVLKEGQIDSQPVAATVAVSGIAVLIGQTTPASHAIARSIQFVEGSNPGVSGIATMDNGMAMLSFSGDGALSVTQSAQGDRIAGTGLVLTAIQLVSTTITSRLSISPMHSAGRLSVGSISGSEPVGTLDAPRLDLTGGGLLMTDAGFISHVFLGDLSNGAQITMPGVASLHSLQIAIGHAAAGTDLNANLPIATLAAVEWDGGTITAPSIAKFSVAGDAGMTITASSIGALRIGGNFALGAIQLSGAGKSLCQLRVGKTIDSLILRTAGSIGSIFAREIHDSTLFAGIDPAATGLLTSSAAFVTPAIIENIVVKGLGRPVPAFSNTFIAAKTIGRLDLSGGVLTDNASLPFGISAHLIRKKLTPPATGDFVISILL